MASATSMARCPRTVRAAARRPGREARGPTGSGLRRAASRRRARCVRRPSRRWLRTAILVTIQSRERTCSIARSATITSIPARFSSSGSVTRTRVSSTWPSTSTSPGRCAEPPERHVGGGQRHRVGFDGRDAQNGDENPSPAEQFDDQAEDAGLLADTADADHHVADTTDGLAVRPSTTIPASRAA